MAAPESGRLLVIDDEADSLTPLCDILTGWGYEVSGFASAKDALAALKKDHFDLLLSDLLMPEMDGIELLKAAQRTDPHLLGIIITGRGSIQTAIEAMKGGAFDYILKPLEWKMLKPVLSRAMEVRRLRKDEEKYRTIVEEMTKQKQAEEAVKKSEKKYRTIVENINDALYVHDFEGKIIDINENACKMTGYTKEELVGFDLSKIDSENDRQRFKKRISRLLEKGSLLFEGKHVRKDGLPVPVEISARVVDREGAGAVQGFVRDITERRRIERSLKESEAKYRELVQNANSIILRRDIGGKITFFNEFAQKFFGYSELDILGKNVIGTIVPETDSAGRDLRKMIADIGQNPEAYVTNENENMRADGNRVWIAWTNKAVRDKTGRISEILCVGNDITGRKLAEEAMRRSLEEREALEAQLIQAQKMEAVGTLAGGVAHDFNNILTAVISYLNIMLMKMGADDPLRVYANKVLDSSERAATLVRGLLTFSRKQIINPAPVDVNDIVRKIGPLLTRVIGEDIELRLQPADEVLTVMADSGQIEQVLMNLATNARDAIPDVGALTISTGFVKIDDGFIEAHKYGEAGEYARITFSDSGDGMDEGTRKRMFEPFFTTKEVGKGTGLGLAMVYGIIKQHKGYIECRSEQERGTTFMIYLPLIKSKLKDFGTAAGVPVGTGTETILIAEDNADVRTATKEILLWAGYVVIEAVDGEDAIHKFMEDKDGKIKLLILDVIMPKKNGREVYEEIKGRRPGIRVLFTSGYPADIVHKKRILEDGVHFLAKPFRHDDFLRKVRTALDR